MPGGTTKLNASAAPTPGRAVPVRRHRAGVALAVVKERLDRWRRRWPVLDTALTVQERFGAIGAGPLATSIGLAMFLSLFPLLLVAIAVAGFLEAGSDTFTDDVISSLGLEGTAAETMEETLATAADSRQAASIVGLAGLLWAGLGVVGAIQTGLNTAWQTKGRGLLDKAVALLWLVGAGLLFVSTGAVGTLVRVLPGFAAPLTVAAGLAINVVLFTSTFTLLGNQHVPWRTHLPGAILAGIGFEILKVVGTVVVPQSVADSSALYGALGIVFAVLAWLLLYGRLLMYAAVLNVVRHEARSGTVTVEIEAPRVDGEVPTAANRGGIVTDQGEPAGR
jgi:membrane protein